MGKNRKIFIYTISGIVVLGILLLLFNYLNGYKFRNKIPQINHQQIVNGPVKDQIEEAHKKAYRKPSAENLGKLGMVYHSSANYEEAGTCYNLAIERKKSEWVWNYYRGYLYTEMGKSEEAINSFNAVVDKDPENGHAWYYLGQAHKNLGNTNKAEKAFGQIANFNDKPSQSTTRRDHFSLGTYAEFELARLYFDNGQTEAAKNELNKIIQREYLFGPAYRLLGNIYNLKGNEKLGEKYTIRANDLVTFSPPVDTLIDRLVLMSRSELYLLKKIDEAQKSIHSDWALRLVNNGLQFMPDNKYLITKAIKMHLWKNQNDKAASFTEKHIQLFKEDYIELKNTGMLFFQKNVNSQAVKYWNRALELKPEDDLIRLYLARTYRADGEKQKSLEMLDTLAENNKNNPDFLADIASLLLEYDEKMKAGQLINNLKKVAPSNPKVQKITAQLAEENGRHEKAITFYQLAFEGDPEDLQTIRNLGNLLLEQEMWAVYIDFFKKVMEYHPNNPEFMAKLGEALISSPDESLRNIEDGLEYSERAFTYYDCPPGILVSAGSHLAYAYALTGEKQKAMNTISRTINIGRRLNISQERQDKLEGLYRGIQSMN